MSDIEKQFKEVADSIKVWKPANSPSNEDQLALYSLFKQATEGDVTGSRPGMFNPVGKAKWDAWETKKGMSKEAAMEKYIEEAKRQKEKYV